jgi:ribonuclease P protein component
MPPGARCLLRLRLLVIAAMPSGLVRLKTRADFLRVAGSGRRAVRPGLMLQAAAFPSELDGSEVVRVGFTASRKVGNAVVRNRAKRRLRAAAAEILARNGLPGTDYVLIARAGTGERRYVDLLGELASALRQVTRQADRKDQSGPDPRAGRPAVRPRGGRRIPAGPGRGGSR